MPETKPPYLPDHTHILCDCGELLGMWVDIDGKATPVPAVLLLGQPVPCSWIPTGKMVGKCGKCGKYTALYASKKSMVELMRKYAEDKDRLT